jgi:phenylalanyl-tRNA synthetase beta chain
MYVSTSWLKSLLVLSKTNLVNLKERLTLCGFEVEETKISKILTTTDIILDLLTTTNRPDILSMAGLTQEINNLLNINFKNFNIKKKSNNFFNTSAKGKINFIDNNYKGTVKFISILIEDINIKKIQPWIQKRLLSSNIVTKDNLTDISQYCMLEWGQPIYLYDLDKLRKLTKMNNPKIAVRFAKEGEIIIDNNLKKYLLTPETLIVTAEDIPISIAGSVISNDCCVDSLTKNLLVEISIFDSKIFRKSERSIGIRTESSIFYERGVNKFLISYCCNRFLNLLSLFDLNLLKNIKFSFVYSDQSIFANKKIIISYKNIQKVLGNLENKNNELEEKRIIECLNKLNFKYIQANDFCYVFPPLTRYIDIEEEIDIIEEICRFYGFNNFQSILPHPTRVGRITKYETIKRKFRELFITLGFTEVYNYSLISENLNSPVIINPLITEYSSLRKSLIPQLIKNLEKNIYQSNKIFPIFEIGHNFERNNHNSFYENELISGVFGVNKYRVSWSKKELELDWFQGRAFLEIIFSHLDLKVNFIKKKFISEFYHPENCLSIISNNEEIGIFGKINPKLFSLKSLPKVCFLFELELTKIFKIKRKDKIVSYKPFSFYPSISIDLSLQIPKEIKFDQITYIIKKFGKDLIEAIELFDIYEKFEISQEYYSLGLKVIFKSGSKTLLKTEIDPILLKIEKELKQNLNIKIRS